ncbi:TolC family protein [Cytophagaceae bacterium DM2B3-1]|uniref:TolC family protein n=1 Tax=Xanthocytophaga flava TaxID=3048013 RepID=A0ABT7CQB1_9BACT|nr:TolC family protein [Xanthocytophaga flavus]MDJ1495910.1 TolC family protein [Xanthocytophaga flavus]
MKTILRLLFTFTGFPFTVGRWQLTIASLLLVSVASQAQTSYSLQQAIEYALQNSTTVKNAQLDIETANARIGETRSIGLPQISGQAQLQHNFRIQQSIFDGRANNPLGGFSDPLLQHIYNQLKDNGSVTEYTPTPIDPNAITKLAFGMKNNANLSLTASQLLFNGSYFVGLQAARAYRQFSEKSLTSSKITVVENVTKAYYGVLVNQEQYDLVKVNVDRIEKLLNETREFNKNGFVEKIDVDRIEVQTNNLKVQLQNIERLLNLTMNALKFQMNMPLNENIVLTEKLADLTNTTFTPVASETVNYDQRIEYTLLQQQKQLNLLDLKNIQSGRYPTLGASFTTGYNPAATRLQDITQSDRWINYSFLAFQLNVPIFSGLGKNYQAQQKKIAVKKTENDLVQFKKAVDFQVQQSNVTLQNALESLKMQKRNLDLAQEIVRVTRIKYQQGVGSNIEVINAEASLKEAQTNYYAALYDALIAKVDLDKATGDLYKVQ